MFYIYALTTPMATYTSTLPDDLLAQLAEKAQRLAVPKNRLLEIALRVYLEHLEKAEYIQSFKGAKADKEVINIAESGMADELRQTQA